MVFLRHVLIAVLVCFLPVVSGSAMADQHEGPPLKGPPVPEGVPGGVVPAATGTVVIEMFFAPETGDLIVTSSTSDLTSVFSGVCRDYEGIYHLLRGNMVQITSNCSPPVDITGTALAEVAALAFEDTAVLTGDPFAVAPGAGPEPGEAAPPPPTFEDVTQSTEGNQSQTVTIDDILPITDLCNLQITDDCP